LYSPAEEDPMSQCQVLDGRGMSGCTRRGRVGRPTLGTQVKKVTTRTPTGTKLCMHRPERRFRRPVCLETAPLTSSKPRASSLAKYERTVSLFGLTDIPMSALRSRKTFISSVRMPEHPPFHARRGFEATAPLVALRRSKSPRRRAPQPAAGPPTRAIAGARARAVTMATVRPP